MEWLLAHQGEEIPKEATVQETAPTNEAAADQQTVAAEVVVPPAEAKSLKCDECNRLFKSHIEVEVHAAKSGHSSFSESTEEKKPLTEDEKAAQLALIEEKLKLKRLAREEQEKVDALEKEKVRIKQGKEMIEAKRKTEEMEMVKLLEQRKREKAEEKMARDRVKAQIEADKAARKAKMEGSSAISPPTPTTPPTVSTTTTTNTNPATPQSKKEYTHTKIQIRLPDGQSVTEQFNAKENLAAVRLFVQLNHYPDLPFRLMTAYPKKVFDDDDFEKPLAALGRFQVIDIRKQIRKKFNG